jgi:outer membrane protein OmpA-like peptidoglycan-associated protein
MYYPEVSQMAKLRIPENLLPAGTKIQVTIKNNSAEQKTYFVSSGDSITYPFIANQQSVITLSADGYQSFSDTIRYNSSAYDYCIQDISLVNKTDNQLGLQFNSYFFDIDYAVDADTLLDQLADRKSAREIYLNGLTGINQVYTAWKKNTETIALTKTGTLPNTSFTATTFANTNQFIAANGNPVLFDFNESFIRDDMKGQLDNVVNMLKKDLNTKLQINGHADSKGSSAYNLQLSERRANAVKNYFIISGISPDRLLVQGQGENIPVAPNTRDNGEDNPEGRSLNRRVELILLR